MLPLLPRLGRRLPAVLKIVSSTGDALEQTEHVVEEEGEGEVKQDGTSESLLIEPSDASSSQLCFVCKKSDGKYTCPKCNAKYCSLDCYKSHSVACTESFYKQNVMDEIELQESETKMAEELGDPEQRQEKMQLVSAIANYYQQLAEDEDDMKKSGLIEQTPINDRQQPHLDYDDLLSLIGKHDIEEVMEMMTPEQRKDFEKFLASSELSEVVKPWQPWWFNPNSSSLSITSASSSSSSSTATIEVIEGMKEDKQRKGDEDTTTDKKKAEKEDDEDEDEEELGEVVEQQEQPPTVYSIDEDTKAILRKKKTTTATTIKPLPPLSSLTKQQPSPQLLNNVSNVLYAYAYTMRLYDGVWWEASNNNTDKSRGPSKQQNQRLKQTSRTIECYMVINEISKVLSQNATYSDVSVALNDAMECSLSKPFVANSRSFSISILLDLYCLLYQKSFVLSALSDLLRLLTMTIELDDAQQQQQSTKTKTKSQRKQQQLLVQQRHKVYFFLIWANEVLEEAVTLPLLRNDVKTEYLKLLETVKIRATSSTSGAVAVPMAPSSSSTKPYNPLIAAGASRNPLIQEL